MMLSSCPEFTLAAKFPEGAAISWGGRTISWVAMNNYVHSTSRYLKEIALKKNDRVIVVRDPSPAFYITVLALWRIGARVCSVAADVPDTEVMSVLCAVDPDFVICSRSAKKTWVKGLRYADIEHVVAYGYNDSFLGSEAALDPKVDLEHVAVLSPVPTSAGVVIQELTHAMLQTNAGEFSTLLQALMNGETLVIA